MKFLPPAGPRRLLAASWLVKTIGSGLYLPTSTLYFTRVAGFGVTDVALGLTVAGLVSLAGSVPLGSLADRYGARLVYTALQAVQFVVLVALVSVRSYPLFLIAITVFLLAEQGATAARGALVATVGEGAERIRFRAYLRVVTNIGITIGAALAAVAIQIGTASAYTALLLATAALAIGATLPLRGLPADTPTDVVVPRARPTEVFHDRRYALVTFVCGVLGLHGALLSFALPLWIAGHTTASPVLVPVLVVVNTVMVIFLQTRAARGAENPSAAARLCRRSGFALLAACCVIIPTASLPSWATVTLLVIFTVLLTMGELWSSSGAFGLSFTLAPEGAHGQYQGFFALGRGLATAAAPGLLTALALGGHPSGWLVLGLCFACAGALAPLAVRSPAPRGLR